MASIPVSTPTSPFWVEDNHMVIRPEATSERVSPQVLPPALGEADILGRMWRHLTSPPLIPSPHLL